MDKFDCEMIENNKCLGCVGLYEKDWLGKYQCKQYLELKRKMRYDYKNPITMQIKEKQSTDIKK